jgi:hypothetical protein
MKVKITKPIRVNALGGEVEVTQQEYDRLVLLGAAEIKEVREIPETPKRTTRKAK